MTSVLQYSSIESERFNLRIFRGSTEKLNPSDLLHLIENERVDVAILRIPTSEQHALHQLSQLPFPVVVADTIVRFDIDLRSSPPQPLRNTQLVSHRATEADRAVLEELIDLSFKEYRTHYHSNPLFDPKLVLEGYKQWALSSLNPSNNQVCYLFYMGEQAVAYATYILYENHGEAIIFGAHPNARIRGLYNDLVRHTLQYTQDQGRHRFRGVTQVQNHGVQRVWVREGFEPAYSYCTIHINALLGQRAAQ
jgi:GNAT superfamily N-acetyltransferase